MIFILIYFVAGILFYTILSPILDSIVSLIITAIEAIKAKISVSIARNQATIQSISDEVIPNRKKIDFVIPEEEPEEDEI